MKILDTGIESPPNHVFRNVVSALLDADPNSFDCDICRGQREKNQSYVISGTSPARDVLRISEAGERRFEGNAVLSSNTLGEKLQHDSSRAKGDLFGGKRGKPLCD